MGRSRAVALSAALALAAAMGALPVQAASAQSPSTTVTFPANNDTVSGTSQLLDAVASPPASQVHYEVTGGTLTDAVIATATPTYYGWLAQWNTTTVPNGTYSLQSVALYTGGVTVTSGPVTITVNNPPPTIVVIVPADGSTVSDVTNDVVMDALASPGVTQVVFDWTNVSGGGESFSVPATPTIYGWVGIVPEFDNGCGPLALGYTLQGVATYSGGVSGTSAPISVTVETDDPLC